jgi:hypothetical protein
VSASTSATHRRHWDALYDAKGARQVSWFQPEPVVSLALIDDLRLDPVEPVIDVGGGASMLVDRLVERGHTDVTVRWMSRPRPCAWRNGASPTKLIGCTGKLRTCCNGHRSGASCCGTIGPCSTF